MAGAPARQIPDDQVHCATGNKSCKRQKQIDKDKRKIQRKRKRDKEMAVPQLVKFLMLKFTVEQVTIHAKDIETKRQRQRDKEMALPQLVKFLMLKFTVQQVTIHAKDLYSLSHHYSTLI